MQYGFVLTDLPCNDVFALKKLVSVVLLSRRRHRQTENQGQDQRDPTQLIGAQIRQRGRAQVGHGEPGTESTGCSGKLYRFRSHSFFTEDDSI